MPSPLGHMITGLIIGAVPTNNHKNPEVKRLLIGSFVAAAPDLDMFLVYAGFDYIYAHRTFSHSIVIVFMIFFILSILSYLLSFRNRKFNIPYLLIPICLLSHIGLDMLGVDSYGPKGLMIFWPLSTNFFYTDFHIFNSLFYDGVKLISVKNVTTALVKEVTIIGLVGIIFLSAVRYYRHR
jgi:membrane-bound metal-dependent hydrolase YbcI (DUF457 family)